MPGITAAAGCSAYAGIPLTHRGLANGVRFLTGHGQEDGEPEHDWAGLADPDTTLVIYMGLRRISAIVAALQQGGLPGDTPAAAVERGSTAAQCRVLAPLADLAERVGAAGLSAPALLIIGRVVALADTLDWFMPSPVPAQSAVA